MILNLYTGQSNIPENVTVQCFTSSPTCDAGSLDVLRSNMFTADASEHNLCCYDTSGSPLVDQLITYFRLESGECRSCLRKFNSYYIINVNYELL